MKITHENKGNEIIKSFILIVEGTEEEYGLLDMMDGYYLDSSYIVGIENLIKEAKLFLEEVK